MPLRALFGISVILSFISWGIIAKRYIWPALRRVPRTEALRPLLLLHTFRFVGLAFVIPGVVSPDLPVAFRTPRSVRRPYHLDSGFACNRDAEQCVRNHPGLGIQHSRERRSAIRILPR